jgi:hypothetical protein
MTFTAVKSSPKILFTFVIYYKLPKVNNNPIGENSPNLVTLNLGNPKVGSRFRFLKNGVEAQLYVREQADLSWVVQ